MCKNATPILINALMAMEADPNKFREYDSPNGWGTHVKAHTFLGKFKNICVDYPLAKISVARKGELL